MVEDIVKIVRLSSDPDDGTSSAVLINGELICFSLERFELGNMVNLSCIPEGNYLITRDREERWRVTDVQGRTNIMFHKGNTTNDSTGCILLGMSIGTIGHKFAVLDSTGAFGNFNKKLNHTVQAKLIITSKY